MKARRAQERKGTVSGKETVGVFVVTGRLRTTCNVEMSDREDAM